MKKAYIQPRVNVRTIGEESILTASDTTITVEKPSSDEEQSITVLSKHNDLFSSDMWDDEENN